MPIKFYVLQTQVEENGGEIVYLLDKNYHISYVTPVEADAIKFESRKQAKKFLEIYKMDENYWKIVKFKQQ